MSETSQRFNLVLVSILAVDDLVLKCQVISTDSNGLRLIVHNHKKCLPLMKRNKDLKFILKEKKRTCVSVDLPAEIYHAQEAGWSANYKLGHPSHW